MRQARAKSIREQVMRYCAKTRHPHPLKVYRTIKKLYLATPKPLRNKFSVAQGGVVV